MDAYARIEATAPTEPQRFGTPAPRHICKAWSGCGRTLLGFLATLSAGLPTVFAAVTVVVLVSLFPARRKQGGIRTAAAMRNLGEEAIQVRCRLMSGGAVLEETEIPLPANGQRSWFIEEVFTMTDTTDFVGTVRCTAPGEGSEGKIFTGLAVEVDAANRIFTTLPVVPLEKRMAQE